MGFTSQEQISMESLKHTSLKEFFSLPPFKNKTKQKQNTNLLGFACGCPDLPLREVLDPTQFN